MTATPRVIHHIYGYKQDTLSENALSNRLSFVKHNAMWTFEMWTPKKIEEEVVPKFSSNIQAAYSMAAGRCNELWVRRVDMARVMVVYLHGGIYTDIEDILCVKPLDSLLGLGLFVTPHPGHDDVEADGLG